MANVWDCCYSDAELIALCDVAEASLYFNQYWDLDSEIFISDDEDVMEGSGVVTGDEGLAVALVDKVEGGMEGITMVEVDEELEEKDEEVDEVIGDVEEEVVDEELDDVDEELDEVEADVEEEGVSVDEKGVVSWVTGLSSKEVDEEVDEMRGDVEEEAVDKVGEELDEEMDEVEADVEEEGVSVDEEGVASWVMGLGPEGVESTVYTLVEEQVLMMRWETVVRGFVDDPPTVSAVTEGLMDEDDISIVEISCDDE